MIIDVSSADVVTVYRALVGVVTPRPIAWVTTIDGQGRVNLAPFSFFNAFCANPPVVVFSPTSCAAMGPGRTPSKTLVTSANSSSMRP